MLTLARPVIHRPLAIPAIDGGWQPACDCDQWAARRTVDNPVVARQVAEHYHCLEANGEAE